MGQVRGQRACPFNRTYNGWGNVVADGDLIYCWTKQSSVFQTGLKTDWSPGEDRRESVGPMNPGIGTRRW